MLNNIIAKLNDIFNLWDDKPATLLFLIGFFIGILMPTKLIIFGLILAGIYGGVKCLDLI